MGEVLEIRDLRVKVEDKEILKGVDLTVEQGEAPVGLELRREGYRTLQESFRPDVPQRLRLVLEPAPAAAPRRPLPKPVPTEERYRRFN